MSKDVIFAGAIALGCLALIAVAFIAPKSKSSEGELPKPETFPPLNDPSLGASTGLGSSGLGTSGLGTSGLGTSGLDQFPQNGPNLNPTGGISSFPPAAGTTTSANNTSGLPPGFGPHPGNPPLGNFPGENPNLGTKLNGPGIVPVPEAPLATENKTHVVVSGEILSDIALKYYKSSKLWKKIADANPTVDPRNLQVGQKLIIPGMAAKSADPTVVTAAGERTYTVKSGDTLYVVAKKELGSASRWKEIEKLNNISSSDLHVGQVIKLPAAAVKETPTDVPGTPANGGAVSGNKTHTVAKGEFLSDISKQYYGTTKHWKKILEANPGTSAEDLKVGQKLVIPEIAGSTQSGPAPLAAGPQLAAPIAADYVVKSGDTLSIIAEKELGSKNRWKELQEANPGLDSRNLRVGQKIKIPGKKNEAPAAPLKPAPGVTPAAPGTNPFGTPGRGASNGPAALPGGLNTQAANQPSGFPADPAFVSPYGSSNFGQPAQPFGQQFPSNGQTGPGFSQTGPAIGQPVGVGSAGEPIPGQAFSGQAFPNQAVPGQPAPGQNSSLTNPNGFPEQALR